MRSVARLAAVLSLLIAARPACAQDGQPEATPPPLTKHELLQKYVWSTLGPTGALQATLWSAFDQWRGSPAAWTKEKRGYAERWASEYASSAIGSTTKYGVARLLHEDPSFVRCDCEGFRPRLRHAVAAPFMARRQDGEWVFSPATIAGIAAENIVPAATWYPAPRGIRGGASHAATGVLSKMAVDVVREFLPKRFKGKPF